MGNYWNRVDYSQISVEELRRKAELSSLNAEKKGRKMEPVILTDRNICKSWWGKSWCLNLESFADYDTRLSRGKRYVRSGAVIDLQIVKGKITARVQGTRKTPYKVEIIITPLKETFCQQIMSTCSKKIESLESLACGEFPEDLKEIFTRKGGLFPTPREISLYCNCPDWAIMCKHVAATLYGVGSRLDENPFLFFTLRGIDIDNLIDTTIANKVESMLAHSNVKSHRVMEDEDVHHLFGIL